MTAPDPLTEQPFESKNHGRTLIPSFRVWGALFLIGVAISIVRQLQIDLAVVNIVTLVLLILGGLVLLVWWCFFSAYSRVVRVLLPLILIAGCALFPIFFRPYRTTGGLIPKFVLRGEPIHDQKLETDLGDDQNEVDLSVRSPSDFPQFLGPDRLSMVTGVRLNPDWQQHPPKKLWQREVGAGWSGFSAVNGYALTMEQRGENELVSCYEVATGRPCWSQGVQTRHETVLGSIGPRSTPTIDGGRVYALGANGHMRCLDGKDGSVVWQRDLLADYGMTLEDSYEAIAWGRASSPLVHEQRVYIPLGGKRDGRCHSLLALDADSGETIWESGQCQAAYASPALMDVCGVTQIVMVNEDFVTGHRLEDGEVLWEHPWPGLSNMNANVSQPIQIDASHIFLSKGYGKGAELLELTVVDDQFDVDVVWNARVMKTKFSNAVIKDGYAYGLDDGILSCVEVQSGERMWKKGRYRYGQILLVDDVIIVLAEDGHLVLVEATPAGHQELAEMEAIEGQTWNTLCLTGDKLLVRNSEVAACFQLALLASIEDPTDENVADENVADESVTDEILADESLADENGGDQADHQAADGGEVADGESVAEESVDGQPRE